MVKDSLTTRTIDRSIVSGFSFRLSVNIRHVSIKHVECVFSADYMLAALVDVLERKEVLTSEEWEKEVKAKIETAAKTTQSFREIES